MIKILILSVAIAAVFGYPVDEGSTLDIVNPIAIQTDPQHIKPVLANLDEPINVPALREEVPAIDVSDDDNDKLEELKTAESYGYGWGGHRHGGWGWGGGYGGWGGGYGGWGRSYGGGWGGGWGGGYYRPYWRHRGWGYW